LSEAESQALSTFLITHRDSIKSYVTLHSYSNTVMHSWGVHQKTYPDDIEDLTRV